MSLPTTYLQMLSTISKEGQLRMELVEKPMPTPAADQVIIKIEATPINPSDHGVMFGWTDMSGCSSSGSGKDMVLCAPVSKYGMGIMKARIDQSLPVGNEGAGTVVAAGESKAAQALMLSLIHI